MAISTYKTFLMHKSGSSFSKLIDICSFPDLGGANETIDVTTLSDPIQLFILGIQSNESMEFEANYTHTDFAAIKALKGEEQDFAIYFGGTEGSDGTVTPTGEDGAYEFSGYIDCHIKGGGVNEKVGLVITVAPSTPFEDTTP